MRRLWVLCAAAVSVGFTPLTVSAQDFLRPGTLDADRTLSDTFHTHTVDWTGWSLDQTVFRPNDSIAKITNGDNNIFVCGLSGIHLYGTASYLFPIPQAEGIVGGPRIKVGGGIIESMPLDYTFRTNLVATFGGELGVTFGRWYTYGYASGGAAWLSAEKLGTGTSNNAVSAREAGAGLRYDLGRGWYAKVELSYTVLGDHRLGSIYIDTRPYPGIAAGIGFRF